MPPRSIGHANDVGGADPALLLDLRPHGEDLRVGRRGPANGFVDGADPRCEHQQQVGIGLEQPTGVVARATPWAHGRCGIGTGSSSPTSATS